VDVQAVHFRFKVCSLCFLSSCSLQNDCSVSVVHIGESTVEIKTKADINDITETANPLHDTPGTRVFVFL